MTVETRRAVTEALEAAGWTGTPTRLAAHLLRHRSGATWQITAQAGGCSLKVPDGPTLVFPSKVPSAVVIAACLAAAGQLDQAPPTESARTAAEYEAKSTVAALLLAEATTTTEMNAVTRVALRAGLLWRCHPCKRDHYLQSPVCSCGARRPAN